MNKYYVAKDSDGEICFIEIDTLPKRCGNFTLLKEITKEEFEKEELKNVEEL